MVVVADGTDETAERLERVLTTDPGTGVLRHADAGYAEAIDAAAARSSSLRCCPSRRVSGRAAAGVCSSATSRSSRRRPGSTAPLRGRGARRRRRDRGRVRPLRGGRIAAVGRMRDLGRSPATSRSSTGAGAARSRARRLPHARVLRRRPRRGVLAARRAARATRSCTPPAAGSSRPSARRARRARTGCAQAVERHRRLDAPRAARRRSRRSPGYGLDRETELASLRAIRGGRRHPDLARRARRPAGVRRRRRVPRLRARRGAAGGGASSPRRRTSSSSAAPSTRRRRAATSKPAAAPGSRSACTATSSRRRARSRSRSSSARARSTTSRRPARTASARWRASDVVGVLLPASALFLDRPMPPARALVDAGAAVALATDFNPGSAFCESLPLVCSLACTQLRLSPAEALAACTVNAAHVLGRAGRGRAARARLRRRPRAARRAGLALPRLPPRRRPRVRAVVVGGEPAALR